MASRSSKSRSRSFLNNARGHRAPLWIRCGSSVFVEAMCEFEQIVHSVDIMVFGRSRFFFFFDTGKDSPDAMSREDLARDLWIHCTSRTKQLGLLIGSLILRRLHPSETILSNKSLLTEMKFIIPLEQFGISGPIPSRRPQKSAAADIKTQARALRSCYARLRLRRAAWRAYSRMWRAAWCLRR